MAGEIGSEVRNAGHTWSAIAVRGDGFADFSTAIHVAPVGREGIGVISGVRAAVGSEVVPLKEHQISSKVIGQLESEEIMCFRCTAV